MVRLKLSWWGKKTFALSRVENKTENETAVCEIKWKWNVYLAFCFPLQYVTQKMKMRLRQKSSKSKQMTKVPQIPDCCFISTLFLDGWYRYTLLIQKEMKE